ADGVIGPIRKSVLLVDSTVVDGVVDLIVAVRTVNAMGRKAIDREQS
ncbi:hypothetical protein L195_g060982, partial [Trifolium pratense]